MYPLMLRAKALQAMAVQTLSNPLHQTFLRPVIRSASDTVASIPDRILHRSLKSLPSCVIAHQMGLLKRGV